MIIYFLIFLYLVYTVWHIDVHGHKAHSKVHFIVLFFIFFLFAGLRYKIGGDTLNYMADWDNYPDFWNFQWASDIEDVQNIYTMRRYQPGWILYCMLIKGIFGDYFAAQIITAFILNLAVFKTVRKYSPYPFLTLLFFYVTFNFILLEFEVAREAVAVSVFLLFAFDNWVKKKWVPYYIWTLVAFMFHISAVMMMLLPLVRNLKWTNKQYVLYLIVPVLIAAATGRAFFGGLLSDIAKVRESMQNYGTRTLADTYNINYIISTLFTPSLILVMMVKWRKYMEQRFVPLVFLTACLIIGSIIDFDCIRFSNFIIIPTFIGMTPALQRLMKRQKTVWIAIALMALYSVPQFYTVISGGKESTSRYWPYQTVLYPEQTKTQRQYWR